MDIDYELIGFRIREVRKERGMTQERVAELAGVSPKFVSMIENGIKSASLKVLCEIAGALRISLDELVFGGYFTNESVSNEWDDILMDCSKYERAVLMEATKCLKEMLLRNRRKQ